MSNAHADRILADPRYHVADLGGIISPAPILFREVLLENLDRMLAIARSPSRLRPHCKTHKMGNVAKIELEKGISKHKCATFAEAEMLAEAGVQDILLAYNLVGPNIERAVKFVACYPQVAFSVTADHPAPVASLGIAFTHAHRTLSVLLDLDVGQHRTGIAPGSAAAHLYQQIAKTPGLRAGGLHVYDGHQHQTPREERAAAVAAEWKSVQSFRDDLLGRGLPVPTIVVGGTPTFPLFAAYDDPTLEFSPGTCVFNDAGYAELFPDLEFSPALLLLTRVISRPTPDRLTVDLGYKAVAGDPPAGKRVVFPELPDARQILHSEEHLVLETPLANAYEPGDELFAIPRHVCPTSALHKQVHVAEKGRIVETWPVTARDRRLTI